MIEKLKGKVYTMGDDINTDDIVPSHALTMRCAEDMVECACENIDPNFTKNVEEGTIIVAGENFGCGSSREEAVHVLKILGISAIIAKSFARIYFRNLINNGIPGIILNWKDTSYFYPKDEIEINLEKGIIHNISQDKEFTFKKLPPFLMDIIEKDGILNKLKEDQDLFH
ncbi:MAG: 3-isopropylmalate dehydratase [Promethearchaeia archaeon]